MTTARHGLPHLQTAQAQKEVVHNQALNLLDALLGLVILDRDLSAPPSEPSNGNCYLVADGATGDWDGQDGKIAAWIDGWYFLSPVRGLRAWVDDESLDLVYNGSEWLRPAETGGADFSDDVTVDGDLVAVGDLQSMNGIVYLGDDGALVSADGTYSYWKGPDGVTRLFFGKAGSDNRVIVDLQDDAGGATFQVRNSAGEMQMSVTSQGAMTIEGQFETKAGFSYDGNSGAFGSFTTDDGKTVTVSGGIITAID